MSHPTSGTSSLSPCLPPLYDLLFSVWFAAEGQIHNFGWLKLYSWLLEILRISWWKGELPLPHLFYDNQKNNQSLEHSWDKFLKCQSANIASLKQNQKPAVSSDCTRGKQIFSRLSATCDISITCTLKGSVIITDAMSAPWPCLFPLLRTPVKTKIPSTLAFEIHCVLTVRM